MGIFGIQDGHTAAEISFQTRSLKKYFSLTFKIWYVAVFALERDFASLYTLWGELSQNQLTNASVLSLPGETLKTDGRNYRKRRRTYFLIEMFEKSMKSSLLYIQLTVIHVRIRVFSRDFRAFC